MAVHATVKNGAVCISLCDDPGVRRPRRRPSSFGQGIIALGALQLQQKTRVLGSNQVSDFRELCLQERELLFARVVAKGDVLLSDLLGGSLKGTTH